MLLCCSEIHVTESPSSWVRQRPGVVLLIRCSHPSTVSGSVTSSCALCSVRHGASFGQAKLLSSNGLGCSPPTQSRDPALLTSLSSHQGSSLCPSTAVPFSYGLTPLCTSPAQSQEKLSLWGYVCCPIPRTQSQPQRCDQDGLNAGTPPGST